MILLSSVEHWVDFPASSICLSAWKLASVLNKRHGVIAWRSIFCTIIMISIEFLPILTYQCTWLSYLSVLESQMIVSCLWIRVFLNLWLGPLWQGCHTVDITSFPFPGLNLLFNQFRAEKSTKHCNNDLWRLYLVWNQFL
mgnify:CR=1 FL=1